MRYRCTRCGHVWDARPTRWKYDSPKRCPKCWSRGLTEEVPAAPSVTATHKEARNMMRGSSA